MPSSGRPRGGEDIRKSSAQMWGFLAKELSDVLGIPVDESVAYSMFRVCIKSIPIFLRQVGKRVLSVYSVGRFEVTENTSPTADDSSFALKFYASKKMAEFILGVEKGESSEYDKEKAAVRESVEAAARRAEREARTRKYDKNSFDGGDELLTAQEFEGVRDKLKQDLERQRLTELAEERKSSSTPAPVAPILELSDEEEIQSVPTIDASAYSEQVYTDLPDVSLDFDE